MKYICLLLLYLSISASLYSQSTVSKLKKATNYQKPWASYQFEVDISLLNNQHLVSTAFVQQGNILMATIEPIARKGDLMLIKDSDIYIRAKNAANTIPINTTGHPISPIYYADILNLNWQRDYRIQESSSDKARLCVGLVAKNPSTIYSRVELWMDKKTYQPLESKIYLQSKTLFKLVKFDKVKSISGRKIITQIRFLNATNQEEGVITLKNIKPRITFPSNYFNPQKLDEVSKQLDSSKD